MTDQPLSSPAQAVLCAYRDLSWTPDEEDNGKYLKFSHKAGMAAALRAAADQVVPEQKPWHRTSDATAAKHAVRLELLSIAAELEGNEL